MKKLFICLICEKRYHEMEEAEVCERSHAKPRPEGVVYQPAYLVAPPKEDA